MAPNGRTTTPVTSVPVGLTRKQPLFMRSGPLPNIPYKRLMSIQKTDPNPTYFDAPKTGTPLPTTICTMTLPLQARTNQNQKNGITKPKPQPAQRSAFDDLGTTTFPHALVQTQTTQRPGKSVPFTRLRRSRKRRCPRNRSRRDSPTGCACWPARAVVQRCHAGSAPAGCQGYRPLHR
jgi:hypothetical protein